MVVLRNRDASILAETGGRQFYKDRPIAYADFNRVTKSLRQPGSAMKPIVYLAAFRQGTFNLETVVPDEPISVANGRAQDVKWISNYDGQFKGMIPLRMALAESRNTVAIWITEQIGVDRVLQTARSLGIQTPLAFIRYDGLGRLRSDLAGVGQCVPHYRIGHSYPALRNPQDRPRFERRNLRWQTRVISGPC